jgi:DNA-binding CsgD family transcriptional regulator
MIIDYAPISPSGEFKFNTSYFPQKDNLYRIHIVRKNDPVASLIIGGSDENHIFFIANNHSEIIIKDRSGNEFIKNVAITGYYPNDIIKQIDEIFSYADTTDPDSSPIKSDLIKSAISEKLRYIADTCANPIVSLYAVYKSDFENNYSENRQFYIDYLSKWEKEKSPYFEQFRKNLDIGNRFAASSILVNSALFLLGVLSTVLGLKLFRKRKSIIHDLSLQERKIFSLMLEGKSNKDISEELKIGLSTVKSHVNNIYSKLNIKSRKEALNLDLDIKEKNK